MPALACEPSVHDDRGDLPSFARSGSVPEEEALAVGVSVLGEFQRGAFLAHLELTRKIARKCLGSVDQCLALRFGQKALGLPASGKARCDVRLGRRDRTHGNRFHERGGMDRSIFEGDAAGPVRQVDACLFGHRRGVGEDRIGKVDRIRRGCWCRGERRHRPNRRALGRSLANEAHWLAERQAMDVGGGLYAWRKRSDKLVERDEVGSISGDRRRGRGRRLVEHNQANGDPRPCPAKHLLQPNIEEQRCFVLYLGESGSIEAFGHDGDHPRPICSRSDRTA